MNKISIELLENGKSAKLIKPLNILTDDGKLITVPVGFHTDFASVPRIFWSIIPPWGEYAAAAVVHDYLYSTQTTTRSYADSVFLEVMAQLGVSRWKRWTMYLAVRAGGWVVWNRYWRPMNEDR